MDQVGDITRPRFVKCARCAKRIKVSRTGRLPGYCTVNCRSMAYAKRSRAAKLTLPPSSADERLRRIVWEVLRDVGLVAGGEPPPNWPPQEDAS
jgi:hypothetical protein